MKTFFQKLTDLSSVARTEQMLKERLAELVQELGFDCYAFMNLQPFRTYTVSNSPPEWQARYLAQNYIKVDPIVSMAQARMQAFTWAAESPRQSTDKLVRRFYREAGDFGIRSGVTIPIRTAFGHMSMLTLASHKPTLSLEKDIDQIAAITAVAQLHAKLEQQDVEPTASVHVDLKAKQALCLKWSAEGKTMKDIAAIENISFATVTFHLNNARKALDVGTLPHATALATKLKLI
ncbi:autoinducer-binding transcriptional regulator TraR [Aminobacter aminovorans]|uniref:Autoinducer-binding domain protein n=1 Tax=Aminobacter aminovorans TaxID=83263 RepID=A0AAC9FEU1_AMIAI|nr:autoinducer binding domain-containing protein [Aminobacter aminovorans]AMS45407.1 Autoinducer-binding domain protein [Aminobacter aminovorans]MBB3708885.1 LuxR family transcriptional activator of conjugal transfer of Ti plasmids [Aminobacter aminovorans]